MILYSFPISQHSRRVVSLLEQAGIEYEVRVVDLAKGEHMSPAYLSVNPNHQVPTLVDGDIVIHESNAILRYLCLKFGLEDWYPGDLILRAGVEQWLDWTQCQQSPAVVGIVFNRVFMGEAGDQTAIAKGLEQMKSLNRILEEALEGKQYLVGSKPTIADLALASNIFHLGFANELPVSPNIQSWYDRISQLHGFQKSLPPR